MRIPELAALGALIGALSACRHSPAPSSSGAGGAAAVAGASAGAGATSAAALEAQGKAPVALRAELIDYRLSRTQFLSTFSDFQRAEELAEPAPKEFPGDH